MHYWQSNLNTFFIQIRRDASGAGAETDVTGHLSPFAVVYPDRYIRFVIEVRQTDAFANWFLGLRDRTARARIDIRIRRLSLGNPGDVKPVGDGVSELRLDYGPGYRVYYIQQGSVLIVLLAGGNKSTQERDIRAAKALARDL